MEVELKLSLDPVAAAALRRHPLIAHYRQGRPWTGRVENHYFDTPALDLQRHGIELRLRRVGGRAWQTIKAVRASAAGARAPGGLHRLDEWEVPLARPALDVPALLAWLPAGTAAAGRVRAAAARPGFEARVSTLFTRTTWSLLSVHGDLVELALDVGEIRADGAALPLCEVELELKRGRESALFELAQALQASLPLRPELRGKAERGFARLAQKAPAPPRPAQPVHLAHSTPWWAALRTVVEECLAQVQANEAGVGSSTDVEYVHQMRVGLRRLRSALGLFKPFARPPAAVLDDLRRTADALGEARDAEVLAHATLPRVPAPVSTGMETDTETDGRWTALREAALSEATAARHAAVQALRSPRHVSWQLGLMAWACGLPGHGTGGAAAGGGASADEEAAPVASDARAADDRPHEPLAAFARRRLRRLRRRLVRDGERLQSLDAGARHDARVVAKKLRYATELLGDLQPGHRRRRLRALATLQEQLGLVNDAQVAAARLARLASGSPDLAASVAHAQAWLADDAAQRVRRLGRVWVRVRKEL